jgi:hypothetical protein
MGAQRRRKVLDLEAETRDAALRALWRRVRRQDDVDMEHTVGELVRGGEGGKEKRRTAAYAGEMQDAEREGKRRAMVAEFGDKMPATAVAERGERR